MSSFEGKPIIITMRSQAVPPENRNTSTSSKGLPVEATLHSVASRLLLGISIPLLFMLTVLLVCRVWKRISGLRTQYTNQFLKVYPNDVQHHFRSRSVGHISLLRANVPFYAKSPQYPPVRRHSCGWYASTDPLYGTSWTSVSAPAMSMEELYVQPNAHLFFGHPRSTVSRTQPSVQRQITLSPIKELNGGEGMDGAQNVCVDDADLHSLSRQNSSNSTLRPPESPMDHASNERQRRRRRGNRSTYKARINFSPSVRIHFSLAHRSTGSRDILLTLNRVNRLVMRTPPPTSKSQVLFFTISRCRLLKRKLTVITPVSVAVFRSHAFQHAFHFNLDQEEAQRVQIIVFLPTGLAVKQAQSVSPALVDGKTVLRKRLRLSKRTGNHSARPVVVRLVFVNASRLLHDVPQADADLEWKCVSLRPVNTHNKDTSSIRCV